MGALEDSEEYENQEGNEKRLNTECTPPAHTDGISREGNFGQLEMFEHNL